MGRVTEAKLDREESEGGRGEGRGRRKVGNRR